MRSEWLDGFDSYGSDDPLEETFDALGARFTALDRNGFGFLILFHKDFLVLLKGQ